MRNSIEVSESSSVPTGHPLKQSLLASFASPCRCRQSVFFKAVLGTRGAAVEGIPG